MKVIKVYCEDCDVNTYLEYEWETVQHDQLVMCGICGWGLTVSDANIIELKEV